VAAAGRGAATTYDLWMGTRNERGGLEGGAFRSRVPKRARGVPKFVCRVFFSSKNRNIIIMKNNLFEISL
jgi:hypothetical protein